jgi:hypothetical protein
MRLTPLRRSGLALMVVAALGGQEELRAAEPLFSRHVVPLLSKAGCNAGACHGAVKGQNGFRLTLFGADPALDHERLVRENGGRRLNLTNADASLFLLKASGAVPHEGGRRLTRGTPDYEIVRAWIAGGARADDPGKSRVTRLSVEPRQQTVKSGSSYSVRVRADFADGSSEDVTALCTFDSIDRDVATVDASGTVVARAAGDASIVVRYRAEPVMALVVVPGAEAGAFPEEAPAGFVDRHIVDKLRKLTIQPSEVCDDATFLRRVSLDVTGALPTPEEVRKFLEDQAPDKRARKIDELLRRPGHAALWATKFCDLLKPTGYSGNYGFNEPADARRFYEWLRARLAENLPYDQLAERILTATSREGRAAEDWIQEVKEMAEESAGGGSDLPAYARRKTLDLYWQREGSTGVKGTIQVAHAFLGLRLECAQCHRHPHDVWQQSDLLDFANFFTRISAAGYNGSAPEIAKAAEPMTKEAKELRDRAKKLADQAKDKNLAKAEADKLTAEANALNVKARALEEAGKRLKGTEIHTNVKGASASVSSPLGTQKSERLRLLGAAEPSRIAAGEDPRAAVVAWLRRPDNPFFARAIVNRVWAHYFGRGIVDPPDHLSPLNPPSHPELLQELADGFIKNGYDLRWLHRTILSSRTYQRSSRTNASNRHDTRNYASFYRRRLSAEVLVDAIDHATAGSETFPPELRLPAGARAIELAGEMKADPNNARASALAYALLVFGRPLRNPEVQCDCERETAPTITQLLYLASHPVVREKLAAAEGRPAQIVKQCDDNGRRVEEAFLWTLSRLPTAQEKQACLDYLKDSATPQKGVEGLMWSLLNTREFLLNH